MSLHQNRGISQEGTSMYAEKAEICLWGFCKAGIGVVT